MPRATGGMKSLQPCQPFWKEQTSSVRAVLKTAFWDGTQSLFHEKPHNADFSVKACQLLVPSAREESALLWSTTLPASSSQAPTTPQLLLPGKIGESDMRARLVAEEERQVVVAAGNACLFELHYTEW